MDIKENLNKFFNKKELNSHHLLKLVEQVMDGLPELELNEQAPADQSPVDVDAGKKFVLTLPKFSPTENWGDPGSIDRKNVDEIFKVVPGPADLEAKLKYITRIQQPQKGIKSPRRIIGSLIILESLNAVINSFGASTAGFIFEGFLAALLGGKQEAEVSEKGNLPIQDIIAFTEYGRTANVPMSLKLLKDTTDVKGSYTNLVDALDDFESMVYVVVYKEGGDRSVESISLNQFVFNRDNFLDAITQNSPGRKLVILEGMNFEQSMTRLKQTAGWPERYELLTQTAGYTKKTKTAPAKQEPEQQEPEQEEPQQVTAESLRKMWDEQVLLEGSAAGGTQWHISTAQFKKLGEIIDYKHLGLLQVSSDSIYETASRYLDVLGDTVTDLFSAVANLSDNLNGYFLTKERGEALAKGNQAIENAKVVEEKASEQVKSEK